MLHNPSKCHSHGTWDLGRCERKEQSFQDRTLLSCGWGCKYKKNYARLYWRFKSCRLEEDCNGIYIQRRLGRGGAGRSAAVGRSWNKNKKQHLEWCQLTVGWPCSDMRRRHNWATSTESHCIKVQTWLLPVVTGDRNSSTTPSCYTRQVPDWIQSWLHPEIILWHPGRTKL